MKRIKNVTISPGCISCGTCEVVCPKVFYLDDVSCIHKNVDLTEYQECIKEAAEMCPVEVIKIEWE
jgi:ferredoxin